MRRSTRFVFAVGSGDRGIDGLNASYRVPGETILAMTPRTAFALIAAVIRSIRLLLNGQVRFPHRRVGRVLETADGTRFTVYRETTRATDADPPADGVVLVFRVQTPDAAVATTLRHVLLKPVTNVATPFFVGMPGFRRKLWLVGQSRGEFLELYEWAAAADAERFVETLESLLEPVGFAGSWSFDIVAAPSIEAYVSDGSLSWSDAGASQRRRWSATRLVVLGVLALVGAYWLWKQRQYDPGSEEHL